MTAVGMAEIKDTETPQESRVTCSFLHLGGWGTILPTEMETFGRSMFGGRAAKLVMWMM